MEKNGLMKMLYVEVFCLTTPESRTKLEKENSLVVRAHYKTNTENKQTAAVLQNIIKEAK